MNTRRCSNRNPSQRSRDGHPLVDADVGLGPCLALDVVGQPQNALLTALPMASAPAAQKAADFLC
jgi:hypothetical protein